MMKRIRDGIKCAVKNKAVVLSLVVLFGAGGLFAFDSGFNLQLKGDFGGAYTMPSISEAGLKDLNPMAYAMSGMMSNLLMGGEVEVGYVFRGHDFFKLPENHVFSGLGAYFSIGFSQSSTSQKISASTDGTAANSFDMFMTVHFLPVINFGASGKALFFNSRLAVGLGVFGRMVADMTPEYMVYSTMPSLIPTEVGTIVVTEEMMKKMNPFMVAGKLSLEYNIPVAKTFEVVLGGYMRYSFFRPKYLTMPPSLLKLAQDNNPNFDINKPQMDYWLNSLDFGVTLGAAFKL